MKLKPKSDAHRNDTKWTHGPKQIFEKYETRTGLYIYLFICIPICNKNQNPYVTKKLTQWKKKTDNFRARNQWLESIYTTK